MRGAGLAAAVVLAALLGLCYEGGAHQDKGFEGHECGHAHNPHFKKYWDEHDAIPKEAHRFANSWGVEGVEGATRRLAQDGVGGDEPASFRILADLQLGDLEEEKAAFLKDKLVPGMIGVISRTLNIRKPVQGPLKLPRFCTVVFRFNPEFCVEVGDMCASVQHNLSFVADARVCSSARDSACTILPGGEGAMDADFVLYVTANDDPATCQENSKNVASAGFCTYDMDNVYGLPMRPLAGVANFCPNKILTAPEEYGRMLDIAVHEVFHAILLDSRLLESHMMPDGVSQSSVLETKDGITSVVSPAVQREAAQMLGCPSMEGAPLENEGSNGTRGSHWERRLFNHEMMVGRAVSVIRPVLSNVTLALAEDSGWYIPWYNASSILTYNHLKGCDFLTADCSTNSTAVDKDFCFDDRPGESQGGSCTPDHTAIGFCDTDTELMDGCAMVTPFKNGLCSAPENQGQPSSVDLGPRFQVGSRCFPLSSPNLKRTERNLFVTRISDALCWETVCRNGSVYIVVPKTSVHPRRELVCPEGEMIDLATKGIGFDEGLVGPCPPSRDICDFWGCPNDCSRNGQCYKGKCHCFLGFGGEDCSWPACPDKPCRPGQVCDIFTGLCGGTGAAQPPPPTPTDSGDTPEGAAITEAAVAVVTEGVAVGTGYLAGCSVFVDENGNMVLESSSEAVNTTGVLGNWTLSVMGETEIVVDPRRLPECRDVFTNLVPPFFLWTDSTARVISVLTSLVNSDDPSEDKLATIPQDPPAPAAASGSALQTTASPEASFPDTTTEGDSTVETTSETIQMTPMNGSVGPPPVEETLLEALGLTDGAVVYADLVHEVSSGKGRREEEERGFVVAAVVSNTLLQAASFIGGPGADIRNIVRNVLGQMRRQMLDGSLSALDLATPAGLRRLTASVLEPNDVQEDRLDVYLSTVAALNQELFGIGDRARSLALLDQVAKRQYVHQTLVAPMVARLASSRMTVEEFQSQTSARSLQAAAERAAVSSPAEVLGIEEDSDDDVYNILGQEFERIYVYGAAGGLVVVLLFLLVCCCCCCGSKKEAGAQDHQGDV